MTQVSGEKSTRRSIFRTALGQAGGLVVSSAALLLGCAALLPAADPPQFTFWSSAQQDELKKKLMTKLDESKGANETFVTAESYSGMMFYREGSAPQGEIHQKRSDFGWVRDGEGAVMVGGKLIDGKVTAPDEVRGTLEGGTKRQLSTGDIFYLPANLPHQFLIEPGKHLNIEMLKIQPQGAADEAHIWTAAELKALDQKLKSKLNGEFKAANENLINTPTTRALLLHREATPLSEIHERAAEFHLVRSGQGFMTVGGELTGVKQGAPGEPRSTSAEGGVKRPVAAGDLIYVPAQTVHWFQHEPGKEFTVLVIKIPVE
jgi:mannose-6-phosphate isomerase-like protein (cupin superfamily)